MRSSRRPIAVLVATWLAAAPAGSSPDLPPRLWTPAAIASADYEAGPTFAADGRTMVFFRGYDGFSRYRLFVSRCADGRWGPPVAAPFAGPAAASESDPAFSPDGRYLYFISDRHAPGGEDFDIWRTARRGDGWGAPERLPAPVNSAVSELLPRLDGAGRLYFGSARPGGLGGGDIYVAEEGRSGWRVANLGAPVNSRHFEYEAEVSRDGRTLIVVADRGDRSHLYRFDRAGSGWRERGRVRARDDVFQVSPLLSPTKDRLLFAQAHGERSGELFLTDLSRDPRPDWPPACATARPRR